MSTNYDKFIELYRKGHVIVFDTETSLINEDKSIYVDTPEFIIGSFSIIAGTPFSYAFDSINSLRDLLARSPYIYVGHNIAFDLTQSSFQSWEYPPDNFYWDTAIFEYEYSGQSDTFPSLNDTAAKYALGTKENTVSEMIKSGVQPKDIPTDMLQEYCEQDVALTTEIFKKQVGILKVLPPARAHLILERMRFRLNTHLMSLNGMVMDTSILDNGISSLKFRISDLDLRVKTDMYVSLKEMQYHDINPNSRDQLRLVLFGGEYKVIEPKATGEVYKTGPKAGTPKFRNETHTYQTNGSIYAKGISTVDDKLDESALKELPPSTFVKDLLEYRELSKELNTYFLGYLNSSKVFDYDRKLVAVHCEYKHVGTPTGRISSVKPNMQNLKNE